MLGVDAIPRPQPAATPVEIDIAAARSTEATPATTQTPEAASPVTPASTAGSSESDGRSNASDASRIIDLEPAVPLDRIPGRTEEAQLQWIREHHAEHCPQCGSATDARNIVFGEGDPRADLVFVGEAPGEREDLEGRPFVGPAGELLDKMIAALGLERSQVWITNVVKTRPARNRTPRPDEAAACGPWLASELAVVRPRAIVALGGTPAKHLLATETGITRLRGIWAGCRVGDLEIPVMPTFHPAFVLRQYTTEVRAAVWEDLQAAHARAFDS